MPSTFEERATQVERALSIVKSIEGNAELQNRAFDYLIADQISSPAPRPITHETPPADDTGVTHGEDGSGNGKAAGGKVTARTTPKRVSKASTVTMDKNLDTAPNGIQSWKEFAAEKKPTNQPDKNTTAVYWLKELAKHPKVNASQVVTLYDDANWKPAPDPKNSLQVAASTTGYIDTADMEDIQIGPRGIFRVKSELPVAPKK